MLFHAVTLAFDLLTLNFYGTSGVTRLNSLHNLSEIDTCFDNVGSVIWPVKTRPRYDLQCVWWDFKPCSIYLCVHLQVSIRITNKLTVFTATFTLLVRTMLRTLRLRIGDYRGWNSINMLFSDIFQPNLVVKCILYCLTVVQNFILKSAHNDEISTEVTGR